MANAKMANANMVNVSSRVNRSGSLQAAVEPAAPMEPRPQAEVGGNARG